MDYFRRPPQSMHSLFRGFLEAKAVADWPSGDPQMSFGYGTSLTKLWCYLGHRSRLNFLANPGVHRFFPHDD